MQGEDIDAVLFRCGDVIARERDAFRSATSLLGATLTSIINQDAPHHVRGDAKKVGTIAPFHSALIDEPHVARIAFSDGAVVIETRDPDKLYPAVPEAAARAGALITSLTSPDNNLESVFRYLTDGGK